MHQLKSLIFGPKFFIDTIVELKDFLKFNLYVETSNIEKLGFEYDVLIFHKDVLVNKKTKNFIDSYDAIKILACNKIDKICHYDSILYLPTSVKEINKIVESLSAKKIFNKNSSIKIKSYILDKNEKKLVKEDNFALLTEKEIQLLEMLLNQKKSISKNQILSKVWHYSSDADTHTVETHIYRLRKKINDKFSDEKFILNNKDGYYL